MLFCGMGKALCVWEVSDEKIFVDIMFRTAYIVWYGM